MQRLYFAGTGARECIREEEKDLCRYLVASDMLATKVTQFLGCRAFTIMQCHCCHQDLTFERIGQADDQGNAKSILLDKR